MKRWWQLGHGSGKASGGRPRARQPQGMRKVLASSPVRLLVVCALVLALLPDRLLFFEGIPNGVGVPVRVGMGVLVLVLLAWHRRDWVQRSSYVFPQPTRPNDPLWGESFLPRGNEIGSLGRATGSDWPNLSPDVLRVLGHRLAEPAKARVQVIEQVVINDRYLMREVRTRFCAEAADRTDDILLPYARPRKGRVLEDLHVFDGENREVDTLEYGRTCSLLLLVVGQAFDDITPGSVTPEAREAAMRVVADLITAHLARKIINKKIAELVATAKCPELGGTRAQFLFRELLDIAASRRPLVAMLPCGENVGRRPVTVMFRYVGPLSQPLKLPITDKWERSKQKVRQGFGVGPNRVYLDASRARSCRSYQMRVHAPNQYYVSDAVLLDKRKKEVVAVPNLEHGKPYRSFVSWDTGQAQPTSNLHTNSLRDSKVVRPVFAVRIREIPPGSLALAFAAAVVVTFTVWVCGALFPGLPVRTASAEANSLPQATDVVAFILGVPAVLGAWLSLIGSGRRGVYSSMTSRVSTLCTSILAVTAAGLYLLHSRRPDFAKAWPGRRAVLFVPEIGWSMLFVLALANLVFVGMALVIRLGRFRRPRVAKN